MSQLLWEQKFQDKTAITPPPPLPHPQSTMFYCTADFANIIVPLNLKLWIWDRSRSYPTLLDISKIISPRLSLALPRDWTMVTNDKCKKLTITEHGTVKRITGSTEKLYSTSCTFERHYMSHRMGKPTICIGENKDADQLRGNREADQRLCFRYKDSTTPLLLKSEISRF